jgi:hypothetical protein
MGRGSPPEKGWNPGHMSDSRGGCLRFRCRHQQYRRRSALPGPHLRDIKKDRAIIAGSKLFKRFEQTVKDFIEGGLKIQGMSEGKDKEKDLIKQEKS